MRKLFKKSLACLLAAILCVSLCVAAVPASAETTPAYSISAVTAKAGEEVEIEFSISNFTTIIGAQVKFYVPDVVDTITSVVVNDDAEIPAWTDDNGGYYKVETDEVGQCVHFLSLFGFEGELDSVDVLKFDIKATIKADAAVGDYDYPTPKFELAEDETALLDVAVGTVGKVTVAPAITKFDFYGSNMTLGSSLLFNFFVAQSNITDTGSYAVITKEYADGTNSNTTVPYEKWESYGGSLWKISFSGIAAKEVNDNITCVIYDSADNVISNPKSDSIRDYCLRLYNANTSAKANIAAVDLLYFCAGAQTQFTYDTDDLATNYITEEMAAIATTEAPAENTQVKGSKTVGTVVAIEDKNVMKFFFNGIDKETMYAKISYTDCFGVKQEYDIDGLDFVTYTGNIYGPLVDTLVYGDGYQDVTCTIYNDDGTVYDTCVDSIESAAARLMAAYPDNTFYPSLMRIVVSMKNYLGV